MKRRFRPTSEIPSPILATQLHRRQEPDHSPEMRLAIAVLDDAVRSVTVSSDRRRVRPSSPEFLRARAWILDDNREWPFAFTNLCEMLGLDPGAVRQSLTLQR